MKLRFAKGALLGNPTDLFNGSLNGHTMRAIDIREGHQIDEGAFLAVVLAALEFNAANAKATSLAGVAPDRMGFDTILK